jgi:hypothetical protein
MTILFLAFSEGSQSARYVSAFKDYFQTHLPHYNLVRFFMCMWRLQIQNYMHINDKFCQDIHQCSPDITPIYHTTCLCTTLSQYG